jgi:hypothetical protein
LEALPALQRFDDGALSKSSPFAEPQAPFTPCDCILAEQLAIAPPFTPWQVQDQGPDPLTVLGLPVLQRLLVGAEVNVPPLLVPQAPFISREAEQLAVLPPFEPAHVQIQCPVPLTAEAVPTLQRFDVGAVKKAWLFAEPQTPLTACRLAEQLAFVPPSTPWHVQDQGPEPLTVVGVPALQRFDVGAEVNVAPLLLPQTPLTGWTLMEKIVPIPLLPPP